MQEDRRAAWRVDHRAQHPRYGNDIRGQAAHQSPNIEAEMSKNTRPITILMADDDADDRLLTRDALTESRVINDLHFVEDGEQLMDYLRRRGQFADPALSPRPGFILLDLNMPRKDGRSALEEIKNDPDLRRIPVIIMTTSQAEEDIYRSYDLGANSFITKPVTFERLVELMRVIGQYWIEFVELPTNQAG
jgi:CheY-like chemotaxis protein